MATANWTRMVSSVPKEKAHTQTRKKGGLTRKKGPESEFDEGGPTVTAQNLLRGASDDPTETTRKLEGDVAAREIPRALGDTFW